MADDIRYLSPVDVNNRNTKNIADLKNLALSILTIKIQIF